MPATNLRHARIALIIAGCLALSTTACVKRAPRASSPIQTSAETPSSSGYAEVGMASWYGKKFHGRKTASGERFNMYEFTAAHKTLPFGARVKVTNLDNKKSVVVRINDRGPWTKGRIIDLSYAAAKEIGMIEKGVVKVKVEEVR